jgi:hypothetical protein
MGRPRPAHGRRCMTRPLQNGLPVVMEQERTLSRLAELSAVPVATGVGSLRDGSPACGEKQVLTRRDHGCSVRSRAGSLARRNRSSRTSAPRRKQAVERHAGW